MSRSNTTEVALEASTERFLSGGVTGDTQADELAKESTTCQSTGS